MRHSVDSGTVMLRKMSQARRFNRWMADTVAPFIGSSVLEIGAGIGNLTRFLYQGRTRYLATDTEQEHLDELAQRLGPLSHVHTALWDAEQPLPDSLLQNGFDSVVCLNVLEHIADDGAALRNILRCLRPNGRAVLLVPQGKALYGSLDRVLDHKRRYSRAELASKIAAAGFHLEHLLHFNRAAAPGWFLNARILRRRTLSTSQLALFDRLVPVWRRIDPLLPWPSTSLIAIASRPPDAR